MAAPARGVAALEEPGERQHPDPLEALAERVGAACRAGGVSLALGESCTGGLVAHLLTQVPGASDYLRGAVVAYADEAKAALLDVPPGALVEHGAVSAQVAVAMAGGARGRFGADVGVAVTGIAGPSGGTPQKPVGLTYVAVADDRGTDVRRFLWHGDRHANKRASAQAALELLLERLLARA
jgi:PncC family amidohydrolase